MPLWFARLLTVVGAAAIGASAWLVWLDDLAADALPLRRLIGSDLQEHAASFLTSIALLLVVAAVLAVVGALLPSRAAGFVGGLLALLVVSLMLVQEHLDRDNGLDPALLGPGAWAALAGGVLVVVGSAGLAHQLQRDLVAH